MEDTLSDRDDYLSRSRGTNSRKHLGGGGRWGGASGEWLAFNSTFVIRHSSLCHWSFRTGGPARRSWPQRTQRSQSSRQSPSAVRRILNRPNARRTRSLVGDGELDFRRQRKFALTPLACPRNQGASNNWTSLVPYATFFSRLNHPPRISGNNTTALQGGFATQMTFIPRVS
jgi:hypothetical protein